MTSASESDAEGRLTASLRQGDGAIYGANASGKSTVLDAIGFFHDAVLMSALQRTVAEEFSYRPFLLDDGSRSAPSLYEMDFVLHEVRHTYGFECDSSGIVSEWLYSYPSGKRPVLFRRGRVPTDIFFGRTLTGENATISKLVRPTALLLSVAAVANHAMLGEVHRAIIRSIRYDSSAPLHPKGGRLRFRPDSAP
jgi:hypothetical protein